MNMDTSVRTSNVSSHNLVQPKLCITLVKYATSPSFSSMNSTPSRGTRLSSARLKHHIVYYETSLHLSYSRDQTTNNGRR